MADSGSRQSGVDILSRQSWSTVKSRESGVIVRSWQFRWTTSSSLDRNATESCKSGVCTVSTQRGIRRDLDAEQRWIEHRTWIDP